MSIECEELAVVRRENRKLREDVKILKRTTAFLAKLKDGPRPSTSAALPPLSSARR